MPVTAAILASAKRLAALLQGVGHSMAAGFAPAWRRARPGATDEGNQTIINILSGCGIRTWDSDVLQSLLIPYALVSSSGNVNHYHNRNCAGSMDLV